MSLTNRILIALLTGLALGVATTAWSPPASAALLPIARVVGAAWLDGLRMTIVPLVFALLVTGVASAAGAAQAGETARRALACFAIGLSASALVGALLTATLLHGWPAPAGAVRALGVGDGGHAAADAAKPSLDWLLSFLPANPLKSAVEGEMVPVVLFALVFGFAATRIDESRRALLPAFFQALTDTLLVIVQWVLRLGPIGVFALAFAAGGRAGLSAAGALAHYVAIVVAACVTTTLLTYPAVRLFGRIELVRFARAALPAQAIALSSQSSVASLPAMIEATEGGMAVSTGTRNIVLPMAVSIFRLTSASANVAVAMYAAALHGVPIGPATILVGAGVAAVVSLAAVGLPSQVSFFTAIGPVCLAIGAPVDVLPLLLAVETLPDIFRTVGNVTADMAVTRIVAARSRA